MTEDSAVATGKYKSDADALIAALATAGWTMPTDAKLTEVIESDKIKYSDFEELRFAIEALGGEYNKTRDFSSDSTYKKICGVKRPHRVPRA